jgi:hypothetical protein
MKTYERFINIWLNKGHFFKNYHSVVAYRPGVCESVSNGIAQHKILGSLVISHYVTYQSMDYGLIIANLIWRKIVGWDSTYM